MSTEAPKPLTLSLLDELPAQLPAASGEDALLGQQLTEQYERATGAIKEVLVFGAMVIVLKENLSARGQVKGGKAAKGTGLDGWLKEFAPAISRPSALRFCALAEGLRQEFRLGEKVDLRMLLTAPPESITDEKLLKKRAAIFEFIEGKSQRQLLLQFDKGPHGAGGGKNRPAKPLTAEEQIAVYEEACREDFMETGQALESLGGKWKLRNQAELEQFRDLLGKVHVDITEWLNTKPSRRQVPPAAKFFMDEEGEGK